MNFDWSWFGTYLPEAVFSMATGLIAFFAYRWYSKRGETIIHIGDRVPAEFITRGVWDSAGERIVQDAPRFMNFTIPLLIENHRDIELTIRVHNVWFCECKPEIKKDRFRLPGSCLAPAGIAIRDAAGNIVDPIRISARSMEYIVITGTATSPVCHAGPYGAWHYVYIDWIATPVPIDPFVYKISPHDDLRTFVPDIAPFFPLPPNYFEMQGGVRITTGQLT